MFLSLAPLKTRVGATTVVDAGTSKWSSPEGVPQPSGTCPVGCEPDFPSKTSVGWSTFFIGATVGVGIGFLLKR